MWLEHEQDQELVALFHTIFVCIIGLSIEIMIKKGKAKWKWRVPIKSLPDAIRRLSEVVRGRASFVAIGAREA
jgi:hypothetical protein